MNGKLKIYYTMDIIMNDILKSSNDLEHAGNVLYDNIKDAITRKERKNNGSQV